MQEEMQVPGRRRSNGDSTKVSENNCKSELQILLAFDHRSQVQLPSK